MNSRTLVKPLVPEQLTEDSVAAYKESLRRYDRERLDLHQVSAHQVQQENSIFPSPVSFQVLTFPVARVR